MRILKTRLLNSQIVLYNIAMDIYAEIDRLVSGAITQKRKAEIIGVDESTYSLILSRTRPISKKLARRLGYRRRMVAVYEPITAPPAAEAVGQPAPDGVPE